MRTTPMTMIAALLLAAGTVAAQEPPTPGPQPDVPKTTAAPGIEGATANQFDIVIRGTLYGEGSDQARYQHYRDLRDGGTMDRFRMFKDTDGYKYNLQADHVGYNDQRFSGSYVNFGHVKASFEWNQIPLYYSGTTETLYDRSTSGLLLMSDAIQSGIQNKTLSLNDALTVAPSFDLRTRRDIANANVVYSATPNVDLSFTVRNTQKNGAYPWGGSFGISNAIATEMPVPVDHRTTDVGTNLEFSNDRAYARLAYDGSFFHNNVATLVWDNPARVTDSPTAGPVQGRMALWPNTEMNTVSASGGIKLPGRSRASAFISVGDMTNNNPLLPYTINGALVSPTLDRPNSDVKATVTAMNYLFTSRPASTVWFSARYRQYEYDNRTTPFYVQNGVNYDTSIVALNKDSEPFGQTRHTLDTDATYSPWRYVGFRAGYTREQIDRTYRIVEQTTEDIGRASIDVTGVSWLSVRGVFEHSKRRGTPVDGMELLAIGEQPTLRQYDISDRDQDRFSTVLMVMPTSSLSFNTTVSVGRQDYPGTNFGLRSYDSNVYSVGFDFVPRDQISMGVQYGFEKYKGLQASRTANPLPANTPDYINDPTQQFNDPRRDWTDASADHTHTVDASLNLIKVIPRTDLKFVYSYSHTESTYFYGLTPDTVLPPPVQLTPVVNQLQYGTVDGRYFLTRHVAVGVLYFFDKYRVDDFALNPVASLAQPATGTPTLMMLGYFYAPYTANTLMGRLTYIW